MQLFLLLGSGAGKHTGLPQQHNPLTSTNAPSATDSTWEIHENLKHVITLSYRELMLNVYFLVNISPESKYMKTCSVERLKLSGLNRKTSNGIKSNS